MLQGVEVWEVDKSGYQRFGFTWRRAGHKFKVTVPLTSTSILSRFLNALYIRVFVQQFGSPGSNKTAFQVTCLLFNFIDFMQYKYVYYIVQSYLSKKWNFCMQAYNITTRNGNKTFPLVSILNYSNRIAFHLYTYVYNSLIKSKDRKLIIQSFGYL